MATAQRTTDHDEIRRWVEGRGGHPAIVEGTGGELRIDFGEPEARLEETDWERFFDIFDSRKLAFLYDPEGYMVKFVRGGGQKAQSRNGRRKSGSRKKSTASRKKSTSSRKKSTSSRKKSTSSRKKSTAGRKSSGGRKKSTASRKKSSGGRKKSTASRKSTSSRKKSSNGRKKSSNGRKKSSNGRKKSSGRKYGPKAGRKVERAMHEMKRGELKSGSTGKKVKSRKQAVAIGLSEARRSGGKVPPNPNRRRSRRKRG